MAIKLVDATQLDSNLTSVANAIRTKSGGSGTLTFPNGFVSEIGNIQSSSYPWVTSIETITIGANSITKMSEVQSYFSDYSPYHFIALKTAPNTQNQCVSVTYSSSVLRYRNGDISTCGNTNTYDGVLVEGTQYDIYHY